MDIFTQASERIRTTTHPVLTMLGQTASGKTGLSIQLADHCARHGTKIEIINADSRQLYAKMDIGTAKITREEMCGVPHHLLSVLDPADELNVAWYKTEAEKMIEEIHSRGNVPCLVGGSMLYISAVIDGLALLPPADPKVRTALEELYDYDRGVTLHAELLKQDPETALGIHPNNKPYIIRALEILRAGGPKPSDAKQKSDSPYDLFVIGVRREKEELLHAIEERTRTLLGKGWIDEVKQLMQEGYDKDTPGMKSVGYRDIMDALETGMINSAELSDAIATKTKKYAKRQMTWWKNDQRITWIHPSGSIL